MRANFLDMNREPDTVNGTDASSINATEAEDSNVRNITNDGTAGLGGTKNRSHIMQRAVSLMRPLEDGVDKGVAAPICQDFPLLLHGLGDFEDLDDMDALLDVDGSLLKAKFNNNKLPLLERSKLEMDEADYTVHAPRKYQVLFLSKSFHSHTKQFNVNPACIVRTCEAEECHRDYGYRNW
jgi:hypothetical protein